MIRPACWALVIALVVVGCAGKGDGGATGDDANVTASSGPRVTGPVAKRLVAAFDSMELADHAMAGRVSVDVRGVSCLTSTNGALDENEPLFLVPITTCALDLVGQPNPHHEIKDEAAKADVLMAALGDIDESLVESGMGKSFVLLKKISCEGHGPSAGSDPNDPPPTTVECTLDRDGAASIKADGAKANRLVQRLGLAVPDAIDHAMGGRFSVDIDSLDCKRISNGALDETDPLIGIPVSSCTITVQGKAINVEDGTPKAVALQAALEKAGLKPDSAMGRTGVTATSVSCNGSGSQPFTCSIKP
jgi:hypothetical protein